MKRFKLFAGLGGSFGGAGYQSTELFNNEDNAEWTAYKLACDEYESYEGIHGINTIDDVMEENDIDDVMEAEQIWRDERENWLDYYVIECTNDDCNKCDYKYECYLYESIENE